MSDALNDSAVVVRSSSDDTGELFVTDWAKVSGVVLRECAVSRPMRVSPMLEVSNH